MGRSMRLVAPSFASDEIKRKISEQLKLKVEVMNIGPVVASLSSRPSRELSYDGLLAGGHQWRESWGQVMGFGMWDGRE